MKFRVLKKQRAAERRRRRIEAKQNRGRHTWCMEEAVRARIYIEVRRRGYFYNPVFADTTAIVVT